MDNLRKEFNAHFEMIDKVDPIVTELLAKNISAKEINVIASKITILENRNKFFKEKSVYEEAINDYISGKNTISVIEIAKEKEISSTVLYTEINRYCKAGDKYQYDRCTTQNYPPNCTYQQEESLLKSLKELVEGEELPCSCRTCVLIRCSTLAYEFCQKNNIKYPLKWNTYKHADEKWLKDFEMRNNSKMSSFCNKNCSLH